MHEPVVPGDDGPSPVAPLEAVTRDLLVTLQNLPVYLLAVSFENRSGDGVRRRNLDLGRGFQELFLGEAVLGLWVNPLRSYERPAASIALSLSDSAFS